MCIDIMCVPNTCKDQERALDTLELELQIVMSHHAGAGNKNLLPLQERQVLSQLNCLSSHIH